MMSAALAAACAGQYAGSVVEIGSVSTVPEKAALLDSIAEFETWTGIDIRYSISSDFEVTINAQVEANIPADLVIFPQPGLLHRFVELGRVVDLSTFLHPDWLESNYDPDWLAMGQIDGITAGVWWRYSAKSLVWYAKQPFEAAGYAIPTSWEELLTLSDQMVADGRTPWCVGIESGVATGWPATDWMEDILLRTTTLSNFDRWSQPETLVDRLPFASLEVRNAAELMGRIWFSEGYVFGGRGAIAGLGFDALPPRLLADPPDCFLIRDGSNIINYMPDGAEAGVDYDFFPFPAIDPAYGNPMLIAGDIVAMFEDRPETRAVLDFMSRGESLRDWLRLGGTLSPHRDSQMEWYANDMERRIASAVSAASAIRFDGADLMPSQVGTAAFWREITNWVIGIEDLDTVLQNIDAAWPVD